MRCSGSRAPGFGGLRQWGLGSWGGARHLEDDAEHLRERRVGGGLDDATLADEVNVEASLHSEQQRRVMHGEGGGGDRRQHGLDDLQLHRLILLVLAAADLHAPG